MESFVEEYSLRNPSLWKFCCVFLAEVVVVDSFVVESFVV